MPLFRPEPEEFHFAPIEGSSARRLVDGHGSLHPWLRCYCQTFQVVCPCQKPDQMHSDPGPEMIMSLLELLHIKGKLSVGDSQDMVVSLANR